MGIFGPLGLGILIYLFRNVIGTLVMLVVWVIVLCFALSLVFRFL